MGSNHGTKDRGVVNVEEVGTMLLSIGIAKHGEFGGKLAQYIFKKRSGSVTVSFEEFYSLFIPNPSMDRIVRQLS